MKVDLITIRRMRKVSRMVLKIKRILITPWRNNKRNRGKLMKSKKMMRGKKTMLVRREIINKKKNRRLRIIRYSLRWNKNLRLSKTRKIYQRVWVMSLKCLRIKKIPNKINLISPSYPTSQ
jgi:hypothetical protein